MSDQLTFCCNTVSAKQSEDGDPSRSKESVRIKNNDFTFSDTNVQMQACRKKYCDLCLWKFYHEKPPQENKEQWLCPACRSVCCCAACRRSKSKGFTNDVDRILAMSPATSLACGLVYFGDMWDKNRPPFRLNPGASE